MSAPFRHVPHHRLGQPLAQTAPLVAAAAAAAVLEPSLVAWQVEWPLSVRRQQGMFCNHVFLALLFLVYQGATCVFLQRIATLTVLLPF